MIELRIGSNSYSPILPRADLQVKVDDLYMRGNFWELVPIDYPPQGMDDFPLPPYIPPPRPMIGRLWWPTFGAARFAYATYLIDYYTLGKIRGDLGYTAGPITVAFTDHEADDGETSRDFKMYLVASRPLVRTDSDAAPPGGTDPPAEDDAWLITLVDRRYYWCMQEGGGAVAPVSWTNLFSDLFTRVGTTGAVDSVPGAYGDPDVTRWNPTRMRGKPTAALLDSAALCIGARVVFEPDETVHVRRPGSTQKGLVTTFKAANEARRIGGGKIDDADTARGVPAKVTVVFSPTDSRSVTLVALGLADYGGNTGVANSAAVVWVDGSGSDAKRDQSAADWYDWQLAPLDAVYDGFVLPPASGYVGHAELFHDGFRGYTRIHRPPLNYPVVSNGPSGTASDTCLALLYRKCYADSATPAPCEVDAGCPGRFVQYTWGRVVDTALTPGPPCPVTYTFTGQCGGPGCFPAYHVRNRDYPVWTAGSSRPCCGTEDAGPPDGTVHRLSVVRLWKGQGDYYLFADDPMEDFMRGTGAFDGDGEQGFYRYRDQNVAVWKDSFETRLISAM